MMLHGVTITDYRAQLARAPWKIGTRRKTLYVTVHYNGPKVPSFGYPSGELSQLQFDARYHMRPNAFGVDVSGDGIQYHGATLSNGAHYQLRDWNAKLWHCGNAEGNAYSIAWHVPIGDTQAPTPAQRLGLWRVLDALRAEYGITAVNVRRHSDWKRTKCPGVFLSAMVAEYHTTKRDPRPLEWFVTRYNANVRTKPDVSSDVALNGTAITPAGTVFGVDAIIEEGVPYKGVSTYVHRADGLGFYHLSVVQPYAG